MGRRLNAVQFFGPESERARSVFQTDPHSDSIRIEPRSSRSVTEATIAGTRDAAMTIP